MQQAVQTHSHNAEALKQLQQDVLTNKAKLVADVKICNVLKPYFDRKCSAVSAVPCVLQMFCALTPGDRRRRWTGRFKIEFTSVA